jgi:hypothetical protein
MKKYILAFTLCVATFMFLPFAANAQSNDFGSGGSTSIIGLPSGRAYFQDAASQAQNGSFNNPAGGSSLLQENKGALLIVDSPLSSSRPSSEPEVSNTNIWWAIILGVAALFSLIGITVVLVPKRLWQTDETEGGEATQEDQPTQKPETPVYDAEEAEAEPQASEATEVDAPVVTEAELQQSQTMAEEVVQAVSEGGELNKVQVVEIETEEEIDEKVNKKSAKKRKHGGRPNKKSRK